MITYFLIFVSSSIITSIRADSLSQKIKTAILTIDNKIVKSGFPGCPGEYYLNYDSDWETLVLRKINTFTDEQKCQILSSFPIGDHYWLYKANTRQPAMWLDNVITFGMNDQDWPYTKLLVSQDASETGGPNLAVYVQSYHKIAGAWNIYCLLDACGWLHPDTDGDPCAFNTVRLEVRPGQTSGLFTKFTSLDKSC
jgi:hypothetical protein